MNYALIVAAGKGTRMQSPVAKPYMPLAGVPILRRTLLAFDLCPIIDDSQTGRGPERNGLSGRGSWIAAISASIAGVLSARLMSARPKR